MAKDELPEKETRQDGNDALVMRARDDGNAFILLYDIYYEKIYRYCFVNLRVKQITEDITSMVFIRAASEVRQFKGKTRKQFIEWLSNIASAEIKKYLKKTNLDNQEDEQISIDSKHKERLRIKVLDAFQQGQDQASKIVLYLVGVIVIIVIGLIGLNILLHEPTAVTEMKPKLKKNLEPQKPGKIIERLTVKKPEPEITEPQDQEPEPPAKNEPNQNQKIEKSKTTEALRLTGRVVDWQQRPLQATVTKGPFPKSDADRVVCNMNGQFDINVAETGVEVLTTQCQGAAPSVQAVEIKEQMEPITITLSPPNIISAQVTDINGMPVEGVNASVVGWQGVGSLLFSATTDAEGFFQWESAPPDEVLFDLHKKNYMSVRNYPLKTGIEYKMLMVRPYKVHGTIISGEPTMQIETFIVTVGYFFEKDKITWQDANSVIFTGDKYEINITEPFEFKLKAQSEGFKTVESPTFNLLQNTFDYDFIMHPEQ
jgi:RNA polymerase sigma factor (sigma-70 family)